MADYLNDSLVFLAGKDGISRANSHDEQGGLCIGGIRDVYMGTKSCSGVRRACPAK